MYYSRAGLVMIRLARRELVWVNVTAHPTAAWIAQQITEAFPWDAAPRYLIRDRDAVYGAVVSRRLRAMGIRDKPISAGSPWQNCFAERLIGTIRRAPAISICMSRRPAYVFDGGHKLTMGNSSWAIVRREGAYND
jgi:hypothetical protein